MTSPANDAPCANLDPEKRDDPVAQTIETIAEIHERAEQGVDRNQRTIENITRMLGRPLCVYVILIIVAFWIGGNLIERADHVTPWDEPPFYWLQGLIGLSALLTTIVVLITQNRMSKTAESRARLDLQISLLIEHKVTKVIELLEELRVDMPTVRNREDPTATAMTQPANPNEVMEAIEVRLESAFVEEQHAENAKAEKSEADRNTQTPS